MVAALRSVLVSVTLAAVARLSTAVGAVIRCEPCDAGARTLCDPVPEDCVERVREPGCGCCVTCALAEGRACGVYTGRCGAGLVCRHRPGEPRPLHALLEGRGVCVNQTAPPSSASARQEGARMPEEDSSSNTTSQSVPAGHEQSTDVSPSHNRRTPPYGLHPKAEDIRREQIRKSQSFKIEKSPTAASSNHENIAFESMLEREYGPCRRELDGILNMVKVAHMVNARGFRIPNCDRKGFYRKKQCWPSKGRKRGICWCVDKYGQALPGFEGKERGSVQCYTMESQ
ncbi:insulin-like growth factor-binding protein 3 isoform X2 [Tachysurus fulvidraco]|uniref:insulin-like growth factor-binding protein 3 isoform X2 n=1 Tax=Tachysurus fulvidraco TaxID=1234273 RepID=UPI000F4E6BE6|nr:insulin-like growth factor-binding protein 3 isoform X2 [Tachysurus fulvidraco]